MSSNNTQTSKALEKLSSGLRINRAGDDAAGLAISEKMRGQIRGLDQASRNAQDANSMLNTAEGNLSETQNILQRMKELATQAANDTNVGVDRGEIQKEINQLTSEINRIGNTTEFNTQKLLNGGGVDPTSSTKVSSNGLTVPATLSGGEGNSTITRANSDMTMAAATAATDNGKFFTVTLDNKEYKFTLDSTATTDTVSGTSISIGISGDKTAAQMATAVNNALTSIINNDANLKTKYSSAVTGAGTDHVTISTQALSITSAGNLLGATDGGNVTGGKGDFLTAITNTVKINVKILNISN